MEAKTKGNVRPFGMADKIGYAFGDFGNDFTFMLSSMFMMKFYTDVMGVEPAIVGLLSFSFFVTIQPCAIQGKNNDFFISRSHPAPFSALSGRNVLPDIPEAYKRG